jgi:hypothetical protein
MLRGGRSWPSDWNADTRTENDGKLSVEASIDRSTVGIAPSNGVIEQQVAQMPQAAECPAGLDSS